MKVVTTFFGLTLLSIIVQFTVIEFIDGKIKKDKDDDLTEPQNEDDNVYDKPRALYYRTLANNLNENNSPSTTEYLNVSILRSSIYTTTDLSTTVIDELFDENTSLAGTTDATFSTTEFDNVTEINLFEKKNNTMTIPNIKPRKTVTDACSCNLLIRVCDINCCCDSDCSDSDLKMFKCNEITSTSIDHDDVTCHSSLSNLYWNYGNQMDMFCIAKTNLPERRYVNKKMHDSNTLDKSFKWHSDEKQQSPNTFKRKPYVYGDHIWLLKNGSIKYMDLPISIFNGYCTGRKPLTFLKEETIKCSVKLKDLEMFEIIKASQEATVISVLESTSNSSTLNCSTLHCTNWTIIVCEGAKCVNYNESLHEPTCTDVNCSNLALEFDYIFHYHDFKILNAMIKLHIHKVLNIMPFMIQNINVRFIITNETVKDIVKLSGNPGYLDGLPVIVSYLKENRTDHFYNSSSTAKYILYLENANGLCIITNDTKNYLTFNSIKRTNCRFLYEKEIMFNDTNACNSINKDILELFGVNKNIFISPYGNPQNLKDEDWVSLSQNNVDKEPVYGEYNERGSKLHCYNVITRMSYIFTFADIGEDNKQKMKILSAGINFTAANVTFNTEEISAVLTIDTMFIDETKPSVFEYAAGPHLDIHLPKDFFFPFPNNRSNNLKCNVVISVFTFVYILQQIK